MRHKIYLLAAIILISSFNEEANAAVPKTKDILTVSGVGEVNAKPDIAYLSFGIETNSETAKVAQKQNNQIANEIFKVVKSKFGVGEKDLQTNNFSVYPQYDNSFKGPGKRKIQFYRVSNTVIVKFRNLEKVGDLLDAVMSAGANRVDSVNFGSEKSREYEVAALTEAMEYAHKKASVIAKAAGRNLGKVLVVQQGSQFQPQAPIAAGRFKMEAMSIAADSSVPMASGELTFSSSVYVEYELKD